jgi:hypothetical protein
VSELEIHVHPEVESQLIAILPEQSAFALSAKRIARRAKIVRGI